MTEHPKLAAALKPGADPMDIVSIAFGARLAADRGEFCHCEEPKLTGLDLMCGQCLRENEDQIAQREQKGREPHDFEARPFQEGRTMPSCQWCGWPRGMGMHEDEEPDSAKAGEAS